MMRRRSFLMAAALAWPAAALAKETGELFIKLPIVVIEYWDSDGIFHIVNAEMTAVFREPASVNKKVGDKIVLALSAMAWEDFSKGNPAATLKAVALDVLRKDPATAKVVEVLIIKMMLR